MPLLKIVSESLTLGVFPEKMMAYPKMAPTEAVFQGCSVNTVFLKISQNSQENTCASSCSITKKETLTQVFSCEFCEIFKSTYFYETPPVAASTPTFKTFK